MTAWSQEKHWRAPTPGTIDVWRIDLGRSQGEPDLLDQAERARAARFRVEAPRRQFARARAGLRRILGRSLGEDPTAVRFERGPHGRPGLPDAQASACAGLRVDFNLSHSGALALVAVAFAEHPGSIELGIDVEEHSERRPHDRMAARFFAPPEVAEYTSLTPEARRRAFYRGWTRKEAYLKAWGTGFTFSSRRFTLDLAPVDDERGAALLRATEMPGDDGAGWRFWDLSPAPGYSGSVCARGEVAALRWYELAPFRAGAVSEGDE